MLNAYVAVAQSGAYEPIVPHRGWTRTEKGLVEESLLDRKIEAAGDGIVSKVCGADRKLDRDLQLTPSNKRNNFDPFNSMICTAIESVSPMSQCCFQQSLCKRSEVIQSLAKGGGAINLD